MANNSAEGIRWDLSDLFTAHDDARIEKTLIDCRLQAERFAERFRAATPVCFTPQTRRSRSIKTWSNKSSNAARKLEICCYSSNSHGSQSRMKLPTGSSAIRSSNPIAIILSACAAIARTRSRSSKKNSSTKKTTPDATLSAGCFRR